MTIPLLAVLLAAPEAQLEIGQPQQAAAPPFVGITALDAGIDPRAQRRITEGMYRLLGLRPRDISDLGAWTASLRKSEEHFRRGNTAQAVEVLGQLRETLVSQETVWKESVDLLSDTLLLQGRALLHLGKKEAAKEVFRWHFCLRPHEPPDPARYRPQVVGFYEEHAMVPLAQQRVALELISVPAGLSVWLDGRRLGATPLTIPALIPGRHLLRLEGGVAIHQEIIELSPSTPRQRHRAQLAGQNPWHEKLLSAWRQQQGLFPVTEALKSQTEGTSGVWMAGLAPGTNGMLLHLARFDGAANLIDAASLPLHGDLSNLETVLQTAAAFPNRGPMPREPGTEALIFGQDPRTGPRSWLLVGVTATAVAALAVSVGLLATDQDTSGIYIDPRGLQ